MGSAGRLTHHVLVSRRRSHRRRPTLRRAAHWPSQGMAGAMALDAAHALQAQAQARASLEPARPALPERDDAAGGTRASVLDQPLTQLGWHEPFEWLSLGWRDFSRAPWIGLFYGASFVAMGWLLLACLHSAPQYTLALSAGFLLMGPFLCLGLYEVSRRLERGEAPRIGASLAAWRISSGQLAIFAGVLLVLEMLWGRSAMIVFAISFDGVPDFSGPLSSMMTEDYLTFFALYLAVGALFAGLIYAFSAISMPMMLDQPVDAITAALASMRLVSTQPGVMLLWGALITLAVTLAMLPGLLGLLVVGPVLGHASWHAYRAATTPRADREDRADHG